MRVALGSDGVGGVYPSVHMVRIQYLVHISYTVTAHGLVPAASQSFKIGTTILAEHDFERNQN